MIDRDIFTGILLQQSGVKPNIENIKKYSNIWWFTPSTKSLVSFRLTEAGLTYMLDTVGLESYKIPVTVPIMLSPQCLVFLSRYMNDPYYIGKDYIILFSENRCFEFVLFADDIVRYGLIKSVKARQLRMERLNLRKNKF